MFNCPNVICKKYTDATKHVDYYFLATSKGLLTIRRYKVHGENKYSMSDSYTEQYFKANHFLESEIDTAYFQTLYNKIKTSAASIIKELNANIPEYAKTTDK